MSVCKFCNTQNPEGVPFCSGCGNRIDTDTASPDTAAPDTSTTDTATPNTAFASQPVPAARLYPAYEVPKKLIIGMSFLSIALVEVIDYIFNYISVRHIGRYYDMEDEYITRSNLSVMYASAEKLCGILIVIAVAFLGIYLYNKGCIRNRQPVNTVSYTLVPIFVCVPVFAGMTNTILNLVFDPIQQFLRYNVGSQVVYVVEIVIGCILLLVKLVALIIFNLFVFKKLAEHSNASRKMPSESLFSVPEKMYIKYIAFGIVGYWLAQIVVIGLNKGVLTVFNLITSSASDFDYSNERFFSAVITSIHNVFMSLSYMVMVLIICKGIKEYNKSCENGTVTGLPISVWSAVIPAGCYSLVFRFLQPISKMLTANIISQSIYESDFTSIAYTTVSTVIVDVLSIAGTLLLCKALIPKLQDFANKKRTAQPIMNDCAE